MKKILLGILVVAILGIGGLVLFGLNPIVKRLQPRLLEIASQQLKQPVSAKDISVSVFPSITIDLTDLRIGGAEAQSGSAGRIKLKTSIPKLFSTPVGISGISIDNAQFTVTHRKDGALALGDFVFAAAKENGSSTAGPERRPAAAPASKPISNNDVAFNLTEGAVAGSRIAFIDQSVAPAQTITISNLQMKISDFGGGDAPFSVQAGVFGIDNVKLKGTVDIGRRFNGIPAVDAKLSVAAVDLAELLQTAAAYNIKLPGVDLKNSLAFDVSVINKTDSLSSDLYFDLTPADLVFPPYVKKTGGVPLRASINILTDLHYALRSAAINLTIADSKLNAAFGTEGGENENGRLTISSGELNLAALKQVLLPAEEYALGGSLKLDLAISPLNLKNPGIPSAVSGSVGFENVSAQIPLGAAGSEAATGTAPKKFPIESINGDIGLSGSKISAKNLLVKAAGQPLELGANISGLPKPEMAFYLKSDRLELEQLALAAMAEPPAALSGAGLNELKVTGSYSMQNRSGGADIVFSGGSIAGLPIGAVKSSLAIRPEVTELKPSQISIFGGAAKIAGDIRGSEIKSLAFSLGGSGFALEPISKFGDPNKLIYLTGTLSSVDAAAQASDLGRIKETLNANGSISAGKGSIEGFNLVGGTLGKIGSIPGLGFSLESLIPEQHRYILGGNSTQFDSLTAAVAVDGPLTTIKSFILRHSLYQVSGSGTMTGKDFEFSVQLKLTPNLTGSMLTKEPRLKLMLDPMSNLEIPVRVTRNNGITLIYPDVSRLAKSAVQNTAKEAVGRALDKVAPGLGGAKNVLDNLFK